MFKTNPPEFESSGTDASQSRELPREVPKARRPKSEFATLADFSGWIDEQLDVLESSQDGFKTVTSVRNFFGR